MPSSFCRAVASRRPLPRFFSSTGSPETAPATATPARHDVTSRAVPKVEPIVYGERKVYTVSAFSSGISQYLGRLPVVWVEGEVTELRRSEAWANVFVTLKDARTSATLNVTISRRTYDRLELDPRGRRDGARPGPRGAVRSARPARAPGRR